MGRIGLGRAGLGRAARLRRFLRECGRMKFYLAMVVPCIVWYVVFHYVPIYGLVIAFKDYRFVDGILGSKWVGLLHFRRAFGSAKVLEVIRNTVVISLLRLVFVFPAPIVFALLLNELEAGVYKRFVQTVSYLPYFMSWVVLAVLVRDLLSPSTGAVNRVLQFLGAKPIYFLIEPTWFRPIVILSSIYQGVGWSSIIYLATISSIEPEQYESALVDGATRLQMALRITLPSMQHIISILFVFAVSGLLSAGFDQIYNLYNPLTYSVADVLDTYVYRMGLVYASYSMATAIGLARNVAGFVLLVTANAVARRLGQTGVW